MPSRFKIAAICTSVIVLLILSAWLLTAFPRDERWDVVLVTFDTTRADHLGCYGNPHVQTSTLDRLASEGIQYANCYTSAPLTLPSHTTMMTGLYPFAHGVRDNGQRLDPSASTLAEVLQEKGYATTAAVGAFVLDRRFQLDQGFQSHDDDMSQGEQHGQFHFPERRAEAVTDAAIELLAKEQPGPRFLWVHYFDPHAPYAPPAFDPDTSSLPAYDAECLYGQGAPAAARGDCRV